MDSNSASKEPPPTNRTKLRILVIDDDPDLRALLRMALSQEHEVAEAENGLMGLTMLEHFEPDFVICDIMMPVLDGLETVEAIRKNPRFYDIPVFFLTGERHQDLPELTMEVGGNLYLEKPIDPLRLLDLIQDYVAEMGVTPRAREAKEPAPPTSHAAPEFEHPVRILTIDPNAESMNRIRGLLSDDDKGRWETLWSDDPGECLANLYRLQPDMILYNPRQKMAGIAFIQNLFFRQMLKDHEICFIGSDISQAETETNRKLSGRDPIRLDRPAESVLRQIAEVILAARAKFTPKRHTLEQIREQDRKRKERLRSADTQSRRKQTLRMQEQIDKEAGRY